MSLESETIEWWTRSEVYIVVVVWLCRRGGELLLRIHNHDDDSKEGTEGWRGGVGRGSEKRRFFVFFLFTMNYELIND